MEVEIIISVSNYDDMEEVIFGCIWVIGIMVRSLVTQIDDVKGVK